MPVIVTAGHVDHGKSTLVRRLTGMEPDRWAEERRRGLTIDIGFAWMTLDGASLAFVDVPGHERFVPNMLAGAGSAPAAMLVVAADEGWMPQSAEHLAALDALGVRHGLLVVTKTDCADPAPAARQAQAEIAATSLGEVPVVAVSARTGDGLPALESALRSVLADLPTPDAADDVRLWVDRVFTMPGAGTVVTGTLTAGTLHVGDELCSGDQRVRVRDLQALGVRHDAVGPVTRVAVNLRGAGPTDLRRGDALTTPGVWLATSECDVRLRADAKLHRHLVLHCGSASVPARVRPLGSRFARLTLSRPLPLRFGDRALLRDPGEHRIASGVDVLDVHPPPLNRRGAAKARAAELAGPWDPLRGRGFVPAADAHARGWKGGRCLDGWVVHDADLAELTDRARTLARAWLDEHPLAADVPAEVLRQQLGLPDASLLAHIMPATAARRTLPSTVDKAVRVLEDRWRTHPFRAPEAADLDELGLGPRELAAAARLDRVVAIAPGVYLQPGHEQRAIDILATLDQPFTVSQARRALDTTRRVAIPLLERLDRSGATRKLEEGKHAVVDPAS